VGGFIGGECEGLFGVERWVFIGGEVIILLHQ
jgi:hypothetical protein